MDVRDLIMINRTSLGYSLALAVVLILSMTRRKPTRKRVLLLLSIWLHVCATVARIVSWSCVRIPGTTMRLALAASLTLADVFGILTCLTIMVYVYTDISGERPGEMRRHPLILSLWALNGVNMALALTNPWTHVYYSFTAGNAYVVGRLFWVRNLIFFLQGLMMAPVVVRLRNRNGAGMTARLLCCGVLAVTAEVLEALIPGLSALFPAVSLMLALLSIGVQSRLEEDLAHARAESAESRVRLLSGQIRPHFVFNSLAAIKELVSEDPPQAETAIQDFSDYLRSHLDVMADSRLIPFPLELDHVRHYVALELADSSQPIEVRYELEVEDFLVPPLTVQPLVENAIRHGLRTREEGGTVVVSTRRTSGAVVVEVTDDGHGFSSATAQQTEHWRVGIDNVRERIGRQCAGTLEVASSTKGTTVTICIPEDEQL